MIYSNFLELFPAAIRFAAGPVFSAKEIAIEPQGKGKLKLVAAEWLVPRAVAKERPVLLGQPFQGPMEGHEPLIPQMFHHYELRAWLFKDNPLGMFTPTNPDVSCDKAEFSLMEMPTKLVAP